MCTMRGIKDRPLIWILVCSVVQLRVEPVSCHDRASSPAEEECSLYIAQSTIPGAGLGFFTAVELQSGAKIGYGDVMIPLSDQAYHMKALGPDMAQRPDWPYLDPTADYTWNGPEIGMHRESAHPLAEHEFLIGFAAGMDAAINCHIGLINVDKEYPEYDFAGLHRSSDPGAGAFTPYHGSLNYATAHIPAGGELFKSYGDDWFSTRSSIFGPIPLEEDYPEAEQLIQTMHRIVENRNISESVSQDIWALMTNMPWKSSRTLRAIPTDFDNLNLVAKEGIRASYQPRATRSIRELQSTGRCADTIRPMPSTIRQAGRGAFTTRPFSRGQIVAGTPLLFFPSADNFKMYDGDWLTKDLGDFDASTLKSYQLMYNYCWHPEGNVSSIYMCPYGSGINYINHNQSLANVRLKWAADGEMNHNASLLQQHPSKMYYHAAPPLWMDIVAVRDIGKDEELFLDYGDSWERAWRTHVNNWDKHGYPDDYMSAEEWNEEYEDEMLLTTDEQEQEDDPYPENILLTCLPDIASASMADYISSDVAEELWSPNVIGFPCYITDREEQDDGEFWYRVRYRELEYPVPLTFDESDEWKLSGWIVREAMRFQDAPYTSDIFLDKAFRHPIGFPDDVFPKAWRNIFLPPLPDTVSTMRT